MTSSSKPTTPPHQEDSAGGAAAYPVVATPPATGNIDIAALQIEGDFAVVDVETTGVDPEVDRIIEIAIIRRRGEDFERFSTLVNPGFPIPPTCSAITHLTDEDVADAPTIDEVAPEVARILEGCTKVAHNAAFDAMFVDPVLGMEPAPEQWLCTFRAARHLMPLAPAFGNQVLRYWLKTKPQSEGLGAHRAMDDVHVTMETMGHILSLAKTERGATSIPEVQQLATEVIAVDVIPFGKHAGKRLEEVPDSYFDWALTNMKDLDRDLRISMEREMERRDVKGAAKPPLGDDASAHSGASSDAPTTMPFGKHAGKPLSEVPVSYFEWALENMNSLNERLKTAMRSEIDRRRDGPSPADAHAPAPAAVTPSPAGQESQGVADGSKPIKLTFGMHRGTPVAEAPLDYLKYIASMQGFGERMSPELKDAIVKSIAERSGGTPASTVAAPRRAATPRQAATSGSPGGLTTDAAAQAVDRYAQKAANMPKRGSFFGLGSGMADMDDDGGLPPGPDEDPEPAASAAPLSAPLASFAQPAPARRPRP